MQNNNNKVCRLCLKFVHGTNAELINEVTRKIFDVLLIKLDLDVSEDPLMCCMCSDILDEIYMFKSKCLYSEDIISDHFDSNLKVSLRDILLKIENKPDFNVAQDDVICRLCIKVPANGSYVYLKQASVEMSFSNGMMQIHLLPEMDLSITEEPIICEACHVLLKNYSSLVKNCGDIERNIDLYRNYNGNNVKGTVDLGCVLRFLENKASNCGNNFNEDLVIKQEEDAISIKVEQFADGEDMSYHYVESSNTQVYTGNEKIVIKYEDDRMRVESSGFDQSGDCKSSEDGSSMRKKRSRKRIEGGCFLCTFVADKSSLKDHMESHRGPTKVFGCPECHHYETDVKDRMIQHILKHKDVPDMDMHKCPMCPLKTKYKATLVKHVKLQHNTNMKWYKCEECPLRTKYKSTFLRHQLRHVERQLFVREEVTLSCDMCNFQTNDMHSLRDHMDQHDRFSRPMFKCNQCDYYAKNKRSLDQHLATYTHLPHNTTFCCDMCNFKTKHKRSLRRHIEMCLKRKKKNDGNNKKTKTL